MTDINQNNLPKREEIEEKYKWKLGDIYSTKEKWEEDFKKVKLMSEEILKFKGTLAKGSKQLVKCLTENDEMMSLNDKLFVYAKMKKDENNTNSVYQALSDRAFSLSTEVYANSSFIIPEILSIPEDTLNKYIKNEEKLDIYRHYFKEILRQKKHILSEKEEKLLAMSAEISHAPKDIFTMFNNADIKFPYIQNEEGQDVELTKGRYSSFLESSDRRVRKDAFTALYSTYAKHKNTLAAALISNVKTNKFYATARNYNGSLECSLDSDNISTSVYDNLIDTINENLHLLQRYLRIRKKALNLNALHMYDLYVPIVSDIKKKINYEDAIELVEKGLNPLGEEYLNELRNAFNSGWIDICENEGKTSGAYSWGTHLTHPYVLLNYQSNINDVFTIAHEMGHALHSLYTNKTQPYIYSEYKIFVAEVASTVNESLLMNYMINKTEDKKEKAYLLNHYLEEFRGTVFRQVMFSEFEKIIHQKIEAGEALTADEITKIYMELNMKYYGNEVIIDKEIGMEWARIPHFYNSFYVYKYATGFSAATSICSQILNKEGYILKKYLRFLSSGGSDYPLELLKNTGVDLYSRKPIQDALNVFRKILDELEELI